MRQQLGACTLLICLPALAQQSVNADVQQTGPDAYRVTVTFPAIYEPDQAQAALKGVVGSVCKGRIPTWGRYEFETFEPVTPSKDAQPSTKFVQDFTCGDAAAAKAGTPAPRTPATDADRAEVEARTLDYLARKDRNDFVSTHAMFEDGSLTDVDAWADARRAFNAEAGTPTARKIVGVTFYDDPDNAPRLGRYAAVDFRATFESRSFYCGYVVWIQRADGTWGLVREDEALATDEIVRELPEDQLAKVKQQPGCREPAQ